MALTAGARLGHYEILSALGAGGMGEVFRARDTQLKRDVAIKVLSEAFARDADRVARFQREAEVLATLNHPNIAAVYGLEKTGDVTGIVLELVEGETLADTVARGQLEVSDALPIARQIADALEAAHERGVVHRDLKPANVKIRDDGVVKVLDFGLAKATGPDDYPSGRVTDDSSTMASPAMTHVGVILGTASYMSPEQARGKAVDRRADIWAFGVVLYELLTGRRLFKGETVSDMIAAVLSQEIDYSRLPDGTPDGVRRLVARCLDRDVKKRLQAIGEARCSKKRPAQWSHHQRRAVDGWWPPASSSRRPSSSSPSSGRAAAVAPMQTRRSPRRPDRSPFFPSSTAAAAATTITSRRG